MAWNVDVDVERGDDTRRNTGEQPNRVLRRPTGSNFQKNLI
jgi:hypothetical protein